ncbi:MAG: type II toxin-antitoxin system PemK/MazF family toxin [Gemmatimonadales bacterium]
MRRGEIWTIRPVNHPKPRPGVILSVDAWNLHAPDVIIVPLTTKPGPSRPAVPHQTLKQASFAKCGALAAIPKDRLGQRLGHLDPETLAAVEQEVRRVIGI